MTRVTYGTQSNEEKVWYGFNIETEKINVGRTFEISQIKRVIFQPTSATCSAKSVLSPYFWALLAHFVHKNWAPNTF